MCLRLQSWYVTRSHPWNSLHILKALWARILQASFLKEKATGHLRRKASECFLDSGSIVFSPADG